MSFPDSEFLQMPFERFILDLSEREIIIGLIAVGICILITLFSKCSLELIAAKLTKLEGELALERERSATLESERDKARELTLQGKTLLDIQIEINAKQEREIAYRLREQLRCMDDLSRALKHSSESYRLAQQRDDTIQQLTSVSLRNEIAPDIPELGNGDSDEPEIVPETRQDSNVQEIAATNRVHKLYLDGEDFTRKIRLCDVQDINGNPIKHIEGKIIRICWMDENYYFARVVSVDSNSIYVEKLSEYSWPDKLKHKTALGIPGKYSKYERLWIRPDDMPLSK